MSFILSVGMGVLFHVGEGHCSTWDYTAVHGYLALASFLHLLTYFA
jgi:hypothetical protein